MSCAIPLASAYRPSSDGSVSLPIATLVARARTVVACWPPKVQMVLRTVFRRSPSASGCSLLPTGRRLRGLRDPAPALVDGRNDGLIRSHVLVRPPKTLAQVDLRVIAEVRPGLRHVGLGDAYVPGSRRR